MSVAVHTERAETPAEKTRRIVEEVCVEFDVTLEDLAGPSKERWVSVPRQEAMRRLVAAGRPKPRVAAMFNRDRSTVDYAINQEARMASRRRRLAAQKERGQ